MMTTQNCPNCGLTHDVSVFANGQRVACGCGIHFEVRRNITSVVQAPSGVALPSQPLGEGSVAPTLKNVPAVSREDEDAPTLVPHPSSKRPASSEEKAEAPRDYGTQRPEAPAVSAPTVVGSSKPELPGFELQELLGRGGMGEVWRARQQSLGRMVAVKLLPPRLAKDPEFVTRFEKEATALASLNHPNIVQIIDRGVVGEHYYFAMEYVEGRSLREAIGPGRVTPQQALRIILQVARAIESAHDKGIVHRDLKPENILLDGRDHVKVADFGLAGIRGPDSKLQLTATSVAMGTLNYMAPEQRRDAKHVDGRADLFSLGVMFYEVLTGELPLGRFKLPSVRVPGVDARVDAVVSRLLENEPDARYATAAEVCAELETLVTHSSAPGLAAMDPGDARPVTQKKQVSATQRRLRSGWRRVRAGLTVVGGLVVAGFLVRAFVGPVDVHLGGDKVIIGTSGVSVKPGSKPWPANTDGELLVAANFEERPGTTSRLDLTFTPGQEKLNARSGMWKLVDGELRAWQGGSESDGKLVPRAYIAQRYFSSDDFSAEVLMDVKPLGPEYPVEPDAQHYGELAFRIKDVQVSAFAIPGVGMRLSWRYMTDAGDEVVGNSAQDQADLVEDEMPVPTTGPFLVRLQLKKGKKGVEVEATLNGKRFARKLLPGLEGKVAKVAVGCRNLACTFDDLKVRGLPMPQPKRKVAEQQD